MAGGKEETGEEGDRLENLCSTRQIGLDKSGNFEPGYSALFHGRVQVPFVYVQACSGSAVSDELPVNSFKRTTELDRLNWTG